MATFEEIQRAIAGPYGDNATLYRKTATLVHAAKFPEPFDFAKTLVADLIQVLKRDNLPLPHWELIVNIIGAAAGLYAEEELTDLPENPAVYGLQAYTAAVGQLRDRPIPLTVK